MYPKIDVKKEKKQVQQVQIQGINLTDNYQNGQLESSRNISANRFPYISTTDEPVDVEITIPEGYQPVSMFAWEKLFIVSDEPSGGGGYKCYYDGRYCGDAKNLTVPKQYAVVNSKLVMWPDKVYFDLYEEGSEESHIMSTSQLLFNVEESISAEIPAVRFRKAVSE